MARDAAAMRTAYGTNLNGGNVRVFVADVTDADALQRRESFEPVDLFYAHIGGMDAFARGLKSVAAIRADGRLAELVKNRYASWDNAIGASIEAGKEDFHSFWLVR